MKNIPRIVCTSLILAFLALVLSACGGVVEQLWLQAPDWSRAQFVTTTYASEAVPLALDDEGGIYLFSVASVGDILRPNVVALGRDASNIWESVLDVELSHPDHLQILWVEQALHLFWIDSGGLYTAVLDKSGSLVTASKLLSGETAVKFYAVAPRADGTLTIWYSGSRHNPGIYALPTVEGQGPILIDEQGLLPSLQYDQAGNLHAVWHYYPIGYGNIEFYYAVYPNGEYARGQAELIYQASWNPLNSLVGPWLGLDRDTAYVLWTIRGNVGLSAGKIVSYYHSQPLGEAQPIAKPTPLLFPYNYVLPYDEFEDGVFQVGRRVSLENFTLSSTSALANPFFITTVGDEWAIAFDAQVEYQWRKEKSQVAILFFQDGPPTSYQLLSFTTAESSTPAIVSDDSNYLYLTWRERSGMDGQLIYFASTAPDVRAALETLSGQDITRIVIETLFGMLSGALLSPIVGALWLIVPIILVALTSFLRRSNKPKLNLAGLIFSLALAFGAFWAIKLSSLEAFGARGYVPFSTWIPLIPESMYGPLQWIVPILIGVIAAALTWVFTYQRDSETSPFYVVLIYGAIDTLLTMAVYGTLVFAVY